jgi:hypothetical protein
MYEHGIKMPTRTSLAQRTDDSSPDSFAGQKWEYLKVPQKGFETLQPSRLKHLVARDPVELSSK